MRTGLRPTVREMTGRYLNEHVGDHRPGDEESHGHGSAAMLANVEGSHGEYGGDARIHHHLTQQQSRCRIETAGKHRSKQFEHGSSIIGRSSCASALTRPPAVAGVALCVLNAAASTSC